MKAHDLAKKLLALPDYEVLVCVDTKIIPYDFHGSYNIMADVSNPIANEVHEEDGSVQMAVLIDLKVEGRKP